MAITSVRDVAFSATDPEFRNYVIDSARVGNAAIASGRLAGIYESGAKQGQVRDYDPTVEALRFHGLFLNGESIQPAGVTPVETGVITKPRLIARADVAGSASSAPSTPLYANSADPGVASTLTVTPNGYDPVAILVKQSASGSTIWSVLTFGSYVEAQPQSSRIAAGKNTVYTANGAITLPTENYEQATLTGASSAAMTLAVPGAGQIGFLFTLLRIGGSGTHDVDYTDEAGNAVTFTFSSSRDQISLLAVSTTGWRHI